MRTIQQIVKELKRYCSPYTCDLLDEILRIYSKECSNDPWISVDDDLPKTTDDVWVFDGTDYFAAWYEAKGIHQGWHSFDNSYNPCTPVLYWAPIVHCKPRKEDSQLK